MTDVVTDFDSFVPDLGGDGDDQHSLHLIDADFDQPLQAIRGIRAAARLAKVADDVKHCKGIYDRFKAGEGPQLVALSDDLPKLKESAHALEVESKGAAKGGIDIPDEELAAMHARGVEAGKQPPTEITAASGERFPGDPVAKTAITLMFAAEGNPLGASLLAKRLEHSAEDDLYTDVRGLIKATFPELADTKMVFVQEDGSEA